MGARTDQIPGAQRGTAGQIPRVEGGRIGQAGAGLGQPCPSFPLAEWGAHGSVPTDTPCAQELGSPSVLRNLLVGKEQLQHQEWLL